MLSFIYTFLTTPKGSIICLASICVLLTLFLRFLFGPKGTFRKPEWNTESDSLDALPQWFLRNKEEFLRYSSTYINKKADTHYHLQLKVDHTLRVVKNAFLLSKVEPVFQDKELTRALLLSALYHDIGRFEQFTRYKTFSDASSCNHGLLSCKILKKKNLLKNETKAVRHLVYTAVGLHNRFAIPKNMPKRHAYVLLGVRDADKLDILRIMEGHLAKNNIPDDTVIMHLQEIPALTLQEFSKPFAKKKLPLLEICILLTIFGSFYVRGYLNCFFQNHEDSSKKLDLLTPSLTECKAYTVSKPKRNKSLSLRFKTPQYKMNTNYTTIAPYYDLVTSWFLHSPRQKLIQTLIAFHVRTLLDIGCGTGVLGILAAQHQISYTGVDNSSAMLFFGKNNVARTKPSALQPHLVYADAATVCFPPNSFDCCAFSLMLHETDRNPHELVKKAFKIAPKVAILEWRPPERNLDYLFTFWRHGIERLAGKKHYRHFSQYMRRGGTRGVAEEIGATIIYEKALHCNTLALYILKM